MLEAISTRSPSSYAPPSRRWTAGSLSPVASHSDRTASIASCAAASASTQPCLQSSPAWGMREQIPAITEPASARTKAPARREGSFQRPGGSMTI